jgi:hypothetical protein
MLLLTLPFKKYKLSDVCWGQETSHAPYFSVFFQVVEFDLCRAVMYFWSREAGGRVLNTFFST